MQLINLTRNTTLASDLKIAKTFSDNLFGLLNPKNPRAILFNTRFGIHTFFLSLAIDVIILDQKWQVVRVKENLNPNNLFFWKPKYSLVVELPKGMLKKSRTRIGDRLKIIDWD